VNDINRELDRIGNELHDAARRDLGNQTGRRLPRRRLVVGLAAGVIVLGGVGAGIAATVLD
jgi:hypothetical protein